MTRKTTLKTREPGVKGHFSSWEIAFLATRWYGLGLSNGLTHPSHRSKESSSMSRITHFAVLMCLMTPFVGRANAQSVTIPSFNTGWYESGGAHGVSLSSDNLNYITGRYEGTVHRNYAVFDVSALDQPVRSAVLALFNPSAVDNGGDGFGSSDASETYQIVDVETDLSSLIAGTAGVAAYEDLGDGAIYGEVAVSLVDNGTLVEIQLNASALAALNSSTGDFAIGGFVATLSDRFDDEHAFAWTNDNASRDVALIVNTIPEPSCVMLLTIAFGTTVCRRRKLSIVAPSCVKVF